MSTLEKCAEAAMAGTYLHPDDALAKTRAVLTTLAVNLDEKAVEAAADKISFYAEDDQSSITSLFQAREAITAYLTTIAEQAT